MPRIAIAGAAGTTDPGSRGIGGAIAKILLEKKQDVTILTRQAPEGHFKLEAFAKEGARIKVVDYAQPAMLVEALQGIEILISALKGPALALQIPLAHAAKSAGVKLFMPSEYGFDARRLPENAVPQLLIKLKIQAELRSISVPSALVFCGCLAEMLPGYITPVDGKIKVTGTDKKLVSWTPVPEVAAYVAHIVAELPLETLFNSVHRIESSRYSLEDLARTMQNKHPGVEVVYESADAAEQRWEASNRQTPPDFWRMLFARGGALVAPTESDLTNDLFAGHRWTDVKTLL